MQRTPFFTFTLTLTLGLAPACFPPDPGTASTDAPPPEALDDTDPQPPADPSVPADDLAPTSTTGLAPADDTTITAPADATTLALPDLGEPAQACDPWAPSCPVGQKCAPAVQNPFGHWDSLLCVPIAPNPDRLNQPCAVLGPDGHDTCEAGLVCWDVDPATQLGTCIGLCLGPPEAPSCTDPSAMCTLEGALVSLCLPGCDPLAQDCPDAGSCIANPDDEGATFLCVTDFSGDAGEAFDPCAYLDVCDPGLVCLDPAHALECDPQVEGCCIPFCDLDEPDPCPGQGQACLPWFAEGAPPKHADLGYCGLLP